MNLTEQQKEELILKYDKLIWYCVHHFKRRARSANLSNMDDFYQVSMLEFLRHVDRCETMEEVGDKFPFRDMVNAMCRVILGEQVLTVPKRTTDFSDKLANMPKRASLLLDTLNCGMYDGFLDSVEDREAIGKFMETISPEDQKILRLKWMGYRNGEIARKIGISDVKMTRRLQRLKKKYLDYVA